MNKAENKKRARAIKAVIIDVDGVLTDGRVLEGAPYKAKWRSYSDGQGVSHLRAIGIRVCVITNEKGEHGKAIQDLIDKWNGLPSSASEENPKGWPHVKLYLGMGGPNKIVAAQEWLQEIGVPFKQAAFMGDDVVDAQLLRKVGFSAAPVTGEPYIRKMVHFVSERAASYGAFRDLANFILEAKGINPITLPPQ